MVSDVWWLLVNGVLGIPVALVVAEEVKVRVLVVKGLLASF